MGYEKRGIDGGAGEAGVPASTLYQLAENDTHYTEYVYNDVSGSLTVGMPVFIDVRDAGEWNNRYSGTALTTTTGATGGRVVLGTTAAGTGSNLICVGVFAPTNLQEKPNQYDVIRVCDRGRTLVSAVSKASGTAVLVGDVLIVDTTPGVNLVSGHNTRTTGITVAYAVATSAALASGSTIISVPGSGSTVALVNAHVQIS